MTLFIDPPRVNVDRFRDGPDAIPFRVVAVPPPRRHPSPSEQIVTDIALGLHDYETAAVRVTISGARSARPLLDLHLARVGREDDFRTWIAVPSRHDAVSRALMTQKPTWDAVADLPVALPLRPSTDTKVPCLLVWRTSQEPIATGNFVLKLVVNGLGVTDARRVRVRRDELERPVVVQRQKLRALYERRVQNGKVLGSCDKCGKDLRQSEYARIGLGPECIKSYPHAEILLRQRVAGMVRRATPPCYNVISPEQWVEHVRSVV